MLGHYTKKTIADVFVQSVPRNPYCGNELAYGVTQKPKADALRHQNIQIATDHCHHWLALDVDRPGAVLLPGDLGCDAPPTLIVSNPANGHAHFLWKLNRPVFKADPKPMMLFADVRDAYTTLFGADGSYPAFLTKNPFNAKWRPLQAIREEQARTYDLGELIEGLPVSLKELKEQHREAKEQQAASLASVEGRNVALFDDVRNWAYFNVKHYRNGGDWQQAVFEVAEEFNRQFQCPLPTREVRSVAKSVAGFVWPNSDYDRRCVERSNALFAKRQAARGRLSGAARRKATENKKTTASLMKAQGYPMEAIATELQVSKRTIQRWLNEKIDNRVDS